MAIDIYQALRHHPEVKLSYRLTLLELAKAAKPDGTVSMAYSYISSRIGGSVRTAKRHIKKLVLDFQVLDKRPPRWIATNRYATNTYLFLLKFVPLRAWPPRGDTQVFSSIEAAKQAQNLKNPEEEKKKGDNATLAQEQKDLERGLRFCVPGSERYDVCLTELQRLRSITGP